MHAHEIRLAALTLLMNRGHAFGDDHMPAIHQRVDALEAVITKNGAYPPDAAEAAAPAKKK